jgi:LuxR family maltose regulon positive regulatory protein
MGVALPVPEPYAPPATSLRPGSLSTLVRERAVGDSIRPAATKVLAPALPVHHVPRGRLIAWLEQGDPLLRLVVGPPGAGKSVLVRSWTAVHRTPFAWVSLDAGDDHPDRFWSVVADAVGRATGVPSAPFRGAPEWADHLADVLEEATSDGRPPLTLVLEDYHVITNPQIHEQLTNLVERPARPLQLTLVTRADPRLHTARWRARGELLEVRAADLRFTEDEAATLPPRL